jgi:hypothetical protein
LLDVDKAEWSCIEGDGADLFFERLDAPTAIAGGMGGGIASKNVWVHPRPKESGWGATVRHVLGEHTEQS